MTRHSDPLLGAQQSAHEWLAVVATHLDTDDHRYALRALRSWLHLVRDRLTVDAAVHLGAQLPELLRGVYYEGWTPRLTPTRYHADQFAEMFSDQAGVPRGEVPRAAGAISAALKELFSAGQLEHLSALMPLDLRLELGVPGAEPRESVSSTERRVDAIERRLTILTDALVMLVHGLEELPTSEEDSAGERASRAAQEAHRLLLAQVAARG